MAYKLMTKMEKMAAFLDRQGWLYEMMTNSYTDGDKKIIVSGFHIEQTHDRYYVVDCEGDDVYSASEPRSVFKFIDKAGE